MDKYLQSSSTLFGSLKNAVLGNPVTREYQVGRQIASFGPGLCWRVFEGKKKSTSEEASIFVLEKKMLESFSKREREIILDVMRKGPQQMTKLKHPRILTVQHPLEDSRESLAYATEPILASLANALGRHDNIPPPVPSEIKDYELYDVEKVYGLLQIAEGLAFLHNDVQLVEGNLVPENIIITRGGQWKLAGFHFASASPTTGPQVDWDPGLPVLAKPELNFLAPEHVLAQSKELSSDLYTFGCLLTAVYNNLKAPFDAGNSLTSYKRCIEQLSRYGSDWLRNVPHEVRDHVQLLLNLAPEVRPDANQTIKHPFFDDVAAMTLKYLDSLVQRDDMTKSQFFKNLHRVLSKLPKRVIHQRVLPHLFMEFPNHPMIPFVLPIVLLIADDCTDEEYNSLIFPELKKIFHVKEPVQVLLIFMQKMELLLKKTPHSDVRNFVLPLVFRALESSSPQIQELVLSIIPNFAKMLDYSSMKNAIIPRIKTIICKTPSMAVRVNALVCIGKIVEHLDKFLMMDEVFPALTQVPSREPAVLMGILGIYKQTLANKKISLEKDYIATKAIPFLLPLAVDQGLNATQFNNFMAIIRDMLDIVEQEHRTKLEQLSKLKKEQESALEFVKAVDQSHSLKEMMSKVDKLVIGSPEKVSESFGSNTEFAKIFGGSVKTSESVPQDQDLLSRSEPELKKPTPAAIPHLDSQTRSSPKAEQQQQPQQQQWKQQQQQDQWKQQQQQQQPQQQKWKQQQQQDQWKQQQQQQQQQPWKQQQQPQQQQWKQQQPSSAFQGDANHSMVKSLEPSPFLGGMLQPTQVPDKRAMNTDPSRSYQGNTTPVSAVNSLMVKNLGSLSTASQTMHTRGASNIRPQRPMGSSATAPPSSFDSILTPELKNFKSNQQPMSIAEMQRTQQQQYYQQQPRMAGATSMHQQQSLGMGQLYNSGVMQSQTQSITMYQTQTQHIVPRTQTGLGNQQGGSYQNGGGILAPLVPQNSSVPQQTMGQSKANNLLDLNDLLS